MFRPSQLARIVAVFAVLTISACGGEESNTTSVQGTISVKAALLPLADGIGIMCIGLYDAGKACPVGGGTDFIRVTGQFFKGTDLNANPGFSYTLDLDNIPPGDYLVSARFDADESGCQSAPNSGDVTPKSCVPVTVKDGEVSWADQELSSVIP